MSGLLSNRKILWSCAPGKRRIVRTASGSAPRIRRAHAGGAGQGKRTLAVRTFTP
ncbi:MAG: hypothetical protein U0350_13335 [Caldilineaceae bacterium]